MAGRMTNHFQYTETGKKSKGGFAKKTTSGTSFFVQKSKIVEFRYKKVKPADKPDCRPRPAERFCPGKRPPSVQHYKKHLKFLPASGIMGTQRVAFLRKSGCRNATRVFYEIR